MENGLINAELREIEGQEQQGFIVNDLDQANWCFRKIRALNAKIAETKAFADKERERINIWEKAETKNAQDSIAYFESLLSDYYIRLKHVDPKAKVSTPYGKISSRKSAKWNYNNEDELLSYLKENDSSLVKVKESVDKTELKKKYKDGIDAETGEVLPGVSVSKEETIQIKPIE
ncbi:MULTISPECIES: host-nuclease inhibitor Gam family protein [Clostridium]|uniref:Host-nuclease inhibitor Gam family protein n=1 Tax=Clostridium lapidicellarium TaxID=3240931 RepID=A0ABV4DVX5_9CLOT